MPHDDLHLGVNQFLSPSDELRLADACVNKHGEDMRQATNTPDPCYCAVAPGDSTVVDAMQPREQHTSDDDPLGEDLDIGMSVNDDELGGGLDL